MEEWETVRRRPSRLRSVGMGLAAVVAVGLLLRLGGGDADGGLLDVDRDETAEQPSEEPSEEGTSRPRITRSPPSPSPSPGRSSAAVLPARWDDGPTAPEGQLGVGSAAWDGDRRLYVYGGQSWDEQSGRSTFVGSASVYDAVEERWSALPSPPLEPRFGAALAWTGAELVVWGGSGRTRLYDDGAAYDPEVDRWRPLAPAPLTPRQGSAAVWLGELLLVAGGMDHAGGLADAVLYSPLHDAWTTSADLPDEMTSGGRSLTAASGPTGPLVWSPEQWGPHLTPPLRLADGAWRPTALPGSGRGQAVVGVVGQADGSFLGLRSEHGPNGSEAVPVRLPAGTDTWEVLSEDAVRGVEVAVAALAGSRYYVAVDPAGHGRAYDLDTDRWLTLPAAPGREPYLGPAHVVGFDDGLLLLGPASRMSEPPVIRRLVIEGEPNPLPSDPPDDPAG